MMYRVTWRSKADPKLFGVLVLSKRGLDEFMKHLTCDMIVTRIVGL